MKMFSTKICRIKSSSRRKDLFAYLFGAHAPKAGVRRLLVFGFEEFLELAKRSASFRFAVIIPRHGVLNYAVVLDFRVQGSG